MKSSQSAVVGACESQVLALLDWWVESKRDAILSVLEDADPGVFGSASLEGVGFKILESPPQIEPARPYRDRR